MIQSNVVKLNEYTEYVESHDMSYLGRMSHHQMAHLRRFAPAGHPYFVRDTELADHFERRWKELGGWTPGLSKEVGWDKPGTRKE